MNKLSKITLASITCISVILTKPLPTLAFSPSDLDASNDALASLAVPLKMLRFSSQNILDVAVNDKSLSFAEANASPSSDLSNLYVVTTIDTRINRYDSTSGSLLQATQIGGGPQAATIGGANKDIFVASIGQTTQINRYDRNGAFLGVFATAQSGAALLDPGSLKFSPNSGNLLVSNLGDASTPGFISQFDKDNGSFLNVFASNGNSFKPTGLAFGADSNLYVSDSASKSILRFNGSTGALIGTFASDSNIQGIGDLAFGSNGNLFLGNSTSNMTGNILQFNGTTGAFINAFTSGTSLGAPSSLAFGPDNNLYVADFTNNKIVEFDGTSGAFIKDFATNSSGNTLVAPVGLIFGPAPVPEPTMGVGLPSLLLMGAYFKSKKRRSGEEKAAE
jgi:sugar lactone lactonase YvrE